MMVSYEDLILNIKTFIADSLEMDKQTIFLFNQNTPVLPKNKEYVIIQCTGKNIISLPVRDGDILQQLSALNFQIDCYGQNVSYAWATKLYMLFNSIDYNEILRKTGLSVLTCDAPINLTGIDFSDQYLERWSIQVSLETTDEVEIATRYLDGIDIKPLKV